MTLQSVSTLLRDMDAPFTWEKLSQTAIRLNGELVQTDSYSVCNRMEEILLKCDQLQSELDKQRSMTDALHIQLTDVYNQLRQTKENIEDFRSNVFKLTTPDSVEHVKDRR